MVEYIELLEEKFGFPTKIKLNTPSGEFIMDLNKFTGLDYSNYRKKLFEGDLIGSRDDVKKKILILGDKKYEDIMNEDFLSDMIFDKGVSMLLDKHEKRDENNEFIEILEKNEMFGTVVKIKVTIGDDKFIMNRKGIRGIDYQEQKKSLMNNTYERTNQNIISRCIEDKENFSIGKIMSKPFWYYKRLDLAKQELMSDDKPF